jgi:hypothetical protein
MFITLNKYSLGKKVSLFNLIRSYVNARDALMGFLIFCDPLFYCRLACQLIQALQHLVHVWFYF